MNGRALPLAVLILIGAGWGISVVLAKITVSAGYLPFGLIFWQMAIGTVVTGALLLRRGRGMLHFSRTQLIFCTVIALIGTLLPNTASYQVAVHLPAAILSIILSMIPLMAFPIALAMGNDRFSASKLLGLCLGLSGMIVLSWDGSALPAGVAMIWLAAAFIAPFFYAFEGNLVNKIGTFGLDPVKILFGASVIGTVLSLPVALGTGQFISPLRPFGIPEWAHVLSSTSHVLVYVGYLWLVGRAGPVFAAQVSYFVTLFGIFWAVVLLGESIPVQLWMALALTMAGLFLVQPRARSDVAVHDPV